MEWTGADYANNSAPQFEEAVDMVDLYAHFAPSDVVLDLGCGDGRVTALIATKLKPSAGGKVVGLDSSPSQIEYAKKMHGKSRPNISFMEGDINNLPAELHGKFDWVVSFSCLHRVKDLQHAFKSILGCLKPTGRFMFSFPAFPPFMEKVLHDTRVTVQPWSSYLRDTEDPFTWKVYPNFEDENPHALKLQQTNFIARMEMLLSEAGFDQQLVEVVTKVSSFKDEKQFENFVAQWLDFRQKVPKDEQQQFMEDFVRRHREAIQGRVLADGSQYDASKEGGVKAEGLQVRALAIKPGKGQVS